MAKKTKKLGPGPGRTSKYTLDVPFKVYEYARSGFKDRKIAEALGVSAVTFYDWRNKHPEVRVALDRGRYMATTEKGTDTFQSYVYNRLPEHLKVLWDSIRKVEKEKSGVRRLEALLSQAGKRARQHLFLYALVHCNFNPSDACRKVNISKSTLDGWVLTDPEFAELMDEVHWHKKNFFDGCLVGLCRDGNPAAIIFANRTFNQDRGYKTKVEVDHTGEVSHTHTHSAVPLEALDLPLDVRRQMLEAVRRKQEEGFDIPRLTQAEVVDAG